MQKYKIDLDKFTDLKTDELEIRLGTFKNNAFISEVSSFMYNLIINILKNSKLKYTKSDEIITMYKTGGTDKLKKIQSLEDEIIIKKTLKSREDIYNLGLRIDLSHEERLDSIPLFSKIFDVKNRTRTTFFDKQGLIKIDITRDIHKNGRMIYQIEGEFIKKPNSTQLYQVVDYFGSLNRDITYAQFLVHEINNFSGKKGDELFHPKMPINLKSYNIPFLENYAITSKPDGISKYIIFTELGVFLLGNTSFLLIKKSPIPELIGTIALGEYMKNNIFLLYDILRYKNIDVRYDSIHAKYLLLNNIKSVEHLNIKLLPIFYKKSLDENIKDAFEYININFSLDENDGILLKPINGGTIYKWKPSEHCTIDFATFKNKNSPYYSIYTITTENPKVLFEGSPQYPAENSVNVELPDTLKTIFIDGMIIEYSFDVNTKKFIAIRHRSDKLKANFITTVNSIWDDIHRPLTKILLQEISSLGLIKPGSYTENDIKIICKFINIIKDPEIFTIILKQNKKIYNTFFEVLEKANEKDIHTEIIDLLLPVFKIKI